MSGKLKPTPDPGLNMMTSSQLRLACPSIDCCILVQWLRRDSNRYIPSALLARYLTPFAASVSGLRAVNAILLLYLPHLIADLLDLSRTRTSLRQVGHLREALCISTFPLVYFFGFLYYTDVASLVLVLLAYRQALRKSYATSALVRKRLL
jgi:hypothetical protein